MNDPRRRAILQAAMGAVLAGGLPCAAWAKPNVGAVGDPLVAACLKIYDAWSQRSSLEPEAFLQLSGSLSNGPEAFMARVQNDFAEGRIAVYEGLVISQTEFALWARVGKAALA
jgi:hypothetical protein